MLVFKSFFWNEEGVKIVVKIAAWLIVFKEGTNTLFFYIFEYGA